MKTNPIHATIAIALILAATSYAQDATTTPAPAPAATAPSYPSIDDARATVTSVENDLESKIVAYMSSGASYQPGKIDSILTDAAKKLATDLGAANLLAIANDDSFQVKSEAPASTADTYIHKELLPKALVAACADSDLPAVIDLTNAHHILVYALVEDRWAQSPAIAPTLTAMLTQWQNGIDLEQAVAKAITISMTSTDADLHAAGITTISNGAGKEWLNFALATLTHTATKDATLRGNNDLKSAAQNLFQNTNGSDPINSRLHGDVANLLLVMGDPDALKAVLAAYQADAGASAQAKNNATWRMVKTGKLIVSASGQDPFASAIANPDSTVYDSEKGVWTAP